VNEHEVGKIVRFGIDHPAVKGINFQPAFHAGRHGKHDPMRRITNPHILKLIEAQTDGVFRVSDFVPVPCCFPTCNSVTYAYIDENGNVTPLPRVLNVDDYLDYISNRVMPDLGAELRRALEGLWSSSAALGSEKVADQFAFSCSACGLPDGSLDVKALSNFMFMIMLQDFMDPWTFNQKNLMKCCKEILLPGGQQVPFCAYNSVGYREQAREQLVAQERLRQSARRSGVRYETRPVIFSFPARTDLVAIPK
jgi:7,8-dihydro-6-hydroxymethylpterin dimethyltransferase